MRAFTFVALLALPVLAGSVASGQEIGRVRPVERPVGVGGSAYPQTGTIKPLDLTGSLSGTPNLSGALGGSTGAPGGEAGTVSGEANADWAGDSVIASMIAELPIVDKLRSLNRD
jgi:hypothetical protein